MKKTDGVLDKDTKLAFPGILVIDASAGSGKTETLAQQFIQFLLSDQIKNNDLSKILAITFTHNAAREMKQRIIKWLKILALDLKGEGDKDRIYELFSLKPGDVRDRAAAAVESVISRYSDFHVQTIDSFMGRILRGSADELGMPPDNDITDSYAELTRQAMDVLTAGFGASIPFSEIEKFLDLFNQSQAGKFYWNPSDEIQKQFVQFLTQEGKVLEEIEFTDQTAAAEKIYGELWALYAKVFKLVPEGEVRKSTREGLADGKFNLFNAEFFNGFSAEDCGLTLKGYKLLMETGDGPGLAAKIRPLGPELADLMSLSKYAAYGPLYRRFKICLESSKRWSETIHFDDINKKLSDYIKKELVPEIYYRLGDALYHFLLDEFQDTDRVQWKNIQPLLEEAYSKGGTLFAVGDMKQAIYMFRKADYRIMWDLVRCIKGELGRGCLPASVEDNARIIPLKYNYRSGGKIMDYVDSVFKQRLKGLMPELLPEDRTGLTEYEQKVPDEKKDRGYVRTVIIPESPETPEKKVLIDILEDVVARHGPRHVAILTHDNDVVENIVSWLTEAGIRAASLSSLDIRKRKIVMEICGLLQFLDTPIDDLSFAIFIAGDIFQRAAAKAGKKYDRDAVFDMLVEKALNDEDSKIYTYFRGHPKFRVMWEKYFDGLFGHVGYYPLYDLVCEIYRAFDVFENFPEETGFLVRFLEAVTIMEAEGEADIKDLVGLVNEEEGSKAFNILLPDYMDAVKVMTLHKAKGLGFKVVINLIYAGQKRAENMFFDPQEDNLLIRYLTKGQAACDPHLDRLYSETRLDGRIQDLNLLYVATTRAKDELYNLIVRKVKKEDPKKAAKAKAKNPVTVDLFEEAEIGQKEKAKAEKESHAPTIVTASQKIEIEPAPEEDRKWSVERRLETEKGNLFHEILAGIEYAGADIEEVAAGLTARALAEDRLDCDPDEIKAVILDFLKEPSVKPWFEKKKGREVLREAEFVDEEGALYRMDRILIDPDQVTLIDYKTGGKMNFYEQQMKNYRRILEQVYPGKPIACYWAYVDTRKVEEVA